MWDQGQQCQQSHVAINPSSISNDHVGELQAAQQANAMRAVVSVDQYSSRLYEQPDESRIATMLTSRTAVGQNSPKSHYI